MINPLDVTLEDWFNKKKRSYDGYYDVEWGVPKHYFVKKQTNSSWVKLTEWNTGCMKTAFLRISPGFWRIVENRHPVNRWQDTHGFDGNEKEDLIVIIDGESLKMPKDSAHPTHPRVDAESRRTWSSN